MKHHILFLIPAVCLALLCACGAGKGHKQPEPAAEPLPSLEIKQFSFAHTASDTEGCFRLELTREEDVTHLYAEELFSGGRIADAKIGNDVLDRICELAGEYRVDLWDGFDENAKNVQDGSNFALDITLADGSTISARGSNRFPAYYSEVSSEIRTLYGELMQLYADSEGKEDAL